MHRATLLANLGQGALAAERAVDVLGLVAEHVERHDGNRASLLGDRRRDSIRSSLGLVVAGRKSLSLTLRRRALRGRVVDVGGLDGSHGLLRRLVLHILLLGVLLLLAHVGGIRLL